MSTYYSAPPQAPYPGQDRPYNMSQAPYPQTFPGEERSATPQYSQHWNNSPAPPQQSYNGPPPQQQWDPQRIWAEANGPQNQHSTPMNGSRAGSPFVNEARSGSPFTAPQQQGGENGERGIGATVLGGGAGAFLGHEMGHSKLATIGGLAAGAILANALEHHEKKKHRERDEAQAYDQGFFNGEKRDMSEGRSRGLDDESSYYERDSASYDDDYERPHHHHHHHHHRDDYDDDEYREESSYRRDDSYDHGRRRDDDYYERDSYVQRDDYRRHDDY